MRIQYLAGWPPESSVATLATAGSAWWLSAAAAEPPSSRPPSDWPGLSVSPALLAVPCTPPASLLCSLCFPPVEIVPTNQYRRNSKVTLVYKIKAKLNF